MALNLSDIMALEYMQEFTLIAGKEGLKRPVSSVGIADYEFADSFVEQTLASSDAFLKDSFVISSLLFAENAPEKICSFISIWNSSRLCIPQARSTPNIISLERMDIIQ